jgi:hypothetical protein
MRLLQARCRSAMTGLVGVLALVLAWGGVGSCVPFCPDCCLARAISCPCSSVAHSACEKGEAHACTHPCCMNNPLEPSAVGATLASYTRALALGALSPVSLGIDPLSAVVLAISPSINSLPPPDFLRSVMLII